MNRRKLTVFSVVAVALLSVVAAAADDEAPEAWETVLDLEIIDKILRAHMKQHPELEHPTAWIELDAYSRELPKMFRRRLPLRDGWGEKFVVRSVDGRLVVASHGRNGSLDIAEGKETEELLVDYFPRYTEKFQFDDIVLIVGRGVLNGPRTSEMHQRVTMSNLRSIGTAIETYSIDNSVYPDQENGLQSLRGITPLLVPLYIRTIPLTDSWGNEFLFWSDGLSYIIVSQGADHLLENDYGVDAGMIDLETLGAEFDDPEKDIVFSNGQFVQWPRGLQQ